MNFSEYLIKNRIKEDDFAAGDPKRYAEWQIMFEQMHVNSFYISVKMVLNDVRNAYHLNEIPKAEKPAATETVARPVVRRAAATGSATQPASEAAQHDQPPASEPDLKANRAAIPGRRAVLRKPGAEEVPEVKTEPVSEAGSEAASPENTADTTEKPSVEETAAPKPARARPVFKRPATTPGGETPEHQKPSEPAENPPSPETSTPKPGRARPVFKRPDVEKTSGETPAEAKSEATAAQPEEQPQPAKPAARPRPVFKRPDVSSSKQPETNSVPAEGKSEAATTQNTEAELTPKPAPPRPRPVFKRPETVVPTPNLTGSPEKLSEPAEAKNQSLSEQNPDQATSAEPETEAQNAKPPRPRPVFKRPAPPTEPSPENTGAE